MKCESPHVWQTNGLVWTRGHKKVRSWQVRQASKLLYEMSCLYNACGVLGSHIIKPESGEVWNPESLYSETFRQTTDMIDNSFWRTTYSWYPTFFFSAFYLVTMYHLSWETSFVTNGVAFQERFYCKIYANMGSSIDTVEPALKLWQHHMGPKNVVSQVSTCLRQMVFGNRFNYVVCMYDLLLEVCGLLRQVVPCSSGLSRRVFLKHFSHMCSFMM